MGWHVGVILGWRFYDIGTLLEITDGLHMCILWKNDSKRLELCSA